MEATTTPIRVIAKPHPFRDHHAMLEVGYGLTLEQIVEDALPNPVTRAHAFVAIGAWPIPADRWRLVRPRPGHTVTIGVRPGGGGGGGKVALRVLLTLAVVALAVAAPYSLPATSSLYAGTLGGALLSAGIASAGPMITNSLAPPGTSARL